MIRYRVAPVPCRPPVPCRLLELRSADSTGADGRGRRGHRRQHVDHAQRSGRQGHAAAGRQLRQPEAVDGGVRGAPHGHRRDRRREADRPGIEDARRHGGRVDGPGDRVEDRCRDRRRRPGVVQRQPGARAGRADRSGPRADQVAAHARADRHGVSGVRRSAEDEDAGARHARPAARESVRDGQRFEGTGCGADRAHRVLGFPVPVLPAGIPDHQPGAEHLRRQDQARLPALPAAEPPQRTAGRRGVGVRRRAGQVLAVLREAVRGPDPVVRRGPQTVGRRPWGWT